MLRKLRTTCNLAYSSLEPRPSINFRTPWTTELAFWLSHYGKFVSNTKKSKQNCNYFFTQQIVCPTNLSFLLRTVFNFPPKNSSKRMWTVFVCRSAVARFACREVAHGSGLLLSVEERPRRLTELQSADYSTTQQSTHCCVSLDNRLPTDLRTILTLMRTTRSAAILYAIFFYKNVKYIIKDGTKN